ncbi:NAD(P)/FAD-dependent oxidoreductase [Rhizobium sp. NRK18]|uniref:NAD(P)/FAD-dependent oxidoreductase n=1 Tax=Rhizobium sp. NRK18 TaxID=2964667 RepID=UPI0021C2C317|nr:FAD-dependent oxidoreductase [Rhizobium sp. NRK18]MCQ2003512.1 FAD-binding oxidoreductase [Rhizobium sp. NRK18]
MSQADNTAVASGQSSTGLLIVGGGIMGLWAACKAAAAGLDIVLADAGRLGGGTSNGFLGALMSHQPDRWNAKKQFQFDALVSLEAEIAALEGMTGLSTGYRRCGRLLPLTHEQNRERAFGHADDARRNWQASGADYVWQVLERSPFADWPDAEAAPFGVVLDTFAARVSPRALTATLIAALRQSGRARGLENAAVTAIDPDAGVASVGDKTIRFGHCLIAAGVGSFPLAGALTAAGKPLGKPVKGQAALLKADIDPTLPVIFHDGVYVVPHEDGLVAIGSTSEEEFDRPFSTDALLDDLLKRARVLAPCLRDAAVVERWAGLRPKAIGRDPMAGRHPAHANVSFLTGGFKVSFGIAHRLASAVVGEIIGAPSEIDVPDSFQAARHFALAGKI